MSRLLLRPMSRRGWLILGAAAALIPLFVLLAWAAAQQREQPAGAGINAQFGEIPVASAPAADFALKLNDGRTLRLSGLRGRVVMLDFWASWCAPCRQEAPMLNRVYAAYSDRPVEFVGVNIWDTPGAAELFLTEFGAPYATGPDDDGAVAIDYGVRGIPEKFFIDANGIIRHKYVGPMPENILRAALDDLLSEIDTNAR